MKAGIALGSNLGNRARHIARGMAFLQSLSSGHFRASSVVETAPVDCPEESGAFLNAVAEIDYDGTARALFERLKTFEREEGRTESVRNAPRPLDLDLLYFGQERIEEGDLIVPHPRMAHRRFVLEPLSEIVPDLVLPGRASTISQLLHAL
ncbi:MAG: 2-amino-4-hydroxy-6-hydroxymethyldihydropteridine diphosphokinase [Verrucomicrobium sp.]|nr:2-amino-4-hydroxy-6-hydroxymethyldihydropteridine diphosphokinase [Verrucomicrobium sp.]